MLTKARFVAFAVTAKPEEAKAFYGTVLGLPLIEETDFALVFDAHGSPLRLQKLDAAPEPVATTIGWEVADLAALARDLARRGVAFERFKGIEQDIDGVWTTPDGSRVAWFRDPDGNRISLTQPAPAPAAETDAYARGMATRRSVLGDAHVDRAEANKLPFDEDFQRFIAEGAWGSVWSRPGLTKRERSLLTLALLAALGHHDEVAMHIRATANTGASPEDVSEAMLHVAVYAGVPAANSAIKIAKETYAKMKEAT